MSRALWLPLASPAVPKERVWLCWFEQGAGLVKSQLKSRRAFSVPSTESVAVRIPTVSEASNRTSAVGPLQLPAGMEPPVTFRAGTPFSTSVTLASPSAIWLEELWQFGFVRVQLTLAVNRRIVAPALKVRETGLKPGPVHVPVPVPPLGDAKLTEAIPKTEHDHVPWKDCSEVPAGAVKIHCAVPPASLASLNVESSEVNTALDDMAAGDIPTMAAMPDPGGHEYHVDPLPLTDDIQALFTKPGALAQLTTS